MQHVLRGDPAIGNLGFALDLLNCPAPSLAICLWDIGTNCSSANYNFCSLVPQNVFWPSLQFVPGTGCNGTTSYALPLPNFTFLCGIVMSTRWVGFAPGPLDNYVSNCVTWMITGT